MESTSLKDLIDALGGPVENPCKKTGANVYLTSHDGYLHGDMFWLEGVYYLRYVGEVQYGKSPELCDYMIDNDGLPGEICLTVGQTLLIHERYVSDQRHGKN